jgi:hypothetical protein
MGKLSPVPRPWWQVGLSVLPGLILLLGQVFSPSSLLSTALRPLALAVMILLILSSVLLAARRKSLFQVPVWGLIPLGLLAGFGLLWTMDALGFYPTCLLAAVAGLLFARHNGLSASLFVLVGGMVTTSWAVEPGMYFWDSPFWDTFVNVGMIVSFTILTPIWVLRSRSIVGQAVGLLFPVAAYAAAFVFALGSVRGIPVGQAVPAARPFLALLATTAIAGAVYAWIASRDFTAGEAQKPSAV